MTDTQMLTTHIITFNMDTSRERKREIQPDEHTDAASHTSLHFIWINPGHDPKIGPEVNLTWKLLNKKIVRGHGDMTSDDCKPPVK